MAQGLELGVPAPLFWWCDAATGVEGFCQRDPRGELSVKKLFILLALGAAGIAIWKKVEAGKAEQALWAEVTDPVK